MPAGIAPGALLLGGISLWPAVRIGAWLFHLDSPLEPQFRFLPVCGITLQAVAGAWLMRHLCNRDIHLRQAREALLLMVPVVRGTATIGATSGMTALRLSGTSPVESQAGAWIIWWLDDAVGIVCAAPLLLAWQGMDYRQWRQFAAVHALCCCAPGPRRC
jgi:integral membrane sensor domain MASE1